MTKKKKNPLQAKDNANNANITEIQKLTVSLLLVEPLHQLIM